jgi:hypothetical protein
MQPAANLAVQYFADLLFLSRLTDQMTVDRDTPVYKMIHVMLSHRPTVGNQNCEFDGIHRTTKAHVINQSRCGLMGVVDVLRRMRELGIYEQSLIVLMGDHGAWVPVDTLMNEQDNRSGVQPIWVAMATPVLAVKPPGVMGNIRFSSAPTSVVDVPATISDLLGLRTQFDGMPVFSISNEVQRMRHHLGYDFGTNPDAEDYLFPIQEFLVYGNTLDAGAWHRGAQHLPNVAVQGVSDAP